MKTRWIARAVGALFTAALIAGAWWFLAPPQIGGGTGYVVVKGNSMEPGLHDGDLVITRTRSSYGVEDVVLFESETLGGAPVLHRIVTEAGGRYTTRGDNRTQDDPDRFAADAVVGGLWISVPQVGSALAWLGQPLPLAALVFGLVFVVLAGGREASRRRARAAAPPVHVTPSGSAISHHASSIANTVLVASLAAALLFGVMAALSWTRPLSRGVSIEGGYAHTGSFEYDTVVPRSAVYPDGRIETGQAVFGEVADRIHVGFEYRFSSTDRVSIRGGIALDAVVSDGEGWTRSLVLATAQPFEGATARIAGTLNLRRLDAAVIRMRELTKTGEATFHVAITPRVQVAGYAGSTVIDAVFEPELPFTWDGLALRLDAAGADESPLTPKLEGTTTGTTETAIGFGSISLTTGEARAFAAVGLVVSLLLVAASGLVLARRRARGPADVLHARHGERIVDAEVVIPDGRWVSDVRDAASLGQIAEHYDRVILRTVDGGDDVYLVDDGVAIYRLRAAESRVPAPRFAPAQET